MAGLSVIVSPTPPADNGCKVYLGDGPQIVPPHDTGISARDRHFRLADFFDVAEHPLVRFTSTRVNGLGDGRVHVSGELEAAGARVPVAFDASVRVIDGELELEATTTVDQRRIGMSQGPLRSVRPTAKLHVQTRLVRERPE